VKNGKIRLIGPNFSFDSLIATAIASEAGERVILTQHGYVASQKDLPALFLLEFLFDEYFSWGFSKYGRYDFNHIHALSGGYIQNFADQYVKNKQKNNKIILVNTVSSMLPWACMDNTLGRTNYALDARHRNEIFLQALNKKLLKDVHYRYYSSKAEQLDNKTYFKNKFNEIMLAGEKEGFDLHLELTRCKLAVLDHPGTTLSIIIAMDTPFIMFFSEQTWPMIEENMCIFNKLKEVGIFFNSPIEAALQVNKIYNDVRGWWNDPTRKQVVNEFRHNFARTDKFYWVHWIKELTKIGREKKIAYLSSLLVLIIWLPDDYRHR
jgi:putative transferase (TIGR04331 family)